MIRSSAVPLADDTVEVLILLPPFAAGSGGCLRGRAKVVRVIWSEASAGDALFAVTVPRYRLEPFPAGEIDSKCQPG